MQVNPSRPLPDADLPLRYIGGDSSLDLVNTVDWTAHGLDCERLSSYDRLTRWVEGAGVVTAATGARLRQLAARHPRQARSACDAAHRLRQVLQRLFSAVAAGGPPASPALDDFNDLLAKALRHLHLAPAPGAANAADAGGRAGWRWRECAERLDSPLWPVAWSAANLLTSQEAGRIRVCAGVDCGWMYVDRSRNGFRRWCEMGTCGTREKSRRRFERTHGAAAISQATPGVPVR